MAYEPAHGVHWSDGNSVDDLPRGYYPLRSDGSVRSSVRLRWVDDTPDDPDDNSGHFERIDMHVGYFHGRADGTDMPEGRKVALKTGGRPASPATRRRRRKWFFGVR